MAMSEAAKAARNKYMKEWRAKNPDKVRASYERKWERKAAAMAAEESRQQDEKQGI